MDDRERTIAETIYQQLGGRGFSLMVGMIFPIIVRVDTNAGFVSAFFRWKARSKDNVSLMQVTLDEGTDTYRVFFSRILGGKTSLLHVYDDVYAEDLQPLFEKTTGLVTIPPRVVIVDGVASSREDGRGG